MVAFKNAFERAWQRMSGGVVAWLLGQPVDESDFWHGRKALQYAPVYSCVNAISGAFSLLPCYVKQEVGRNIEKRNNHPSYRLLRWRPNTVQTPSAWKRQAAVHALLWGNARSYIVRDSRQNPIELIPMLPDRTSSGMIDGEKYHMTYMDRDGRLAAAIGSMMTDQDRAELIANLSRENPDNVFWANDADVLHVPGLSVDGIEGVSIVSLARQSFGIGLGSEAHVAKQQKKGYAGGLMLNAPAGAFPDEAEAKEFLEHFREQHAGAERTGTIGMLREGITAQVLAMSNTDAQFIEQRRFQVEEVERWFNMVGMLSGSRTSYASLEQTLLFFRTNTLAPWTTAFEEEFDVKLLRKREQNAEYFHEFDDSKLLKTEKSQLMAFISQGITSRVLNPNEGREMLGMNPYEGGDEFANPAISPGTPGQQQDAEDPEDDDDDEEDDDMAAEMSRIRQLIVTESNRVIQAAEQAVSKGKNYVDWIDKFYAGQWRIKFRAAMEAIAIDPQFAENHCDRSKEQLLGVCDDSTLETLVANVKTCVSGWDKRAELAKKVQICSQ